jgi:hypothetical protein
MAFIRDEILKAWDAAIASVAQNREDPTDEEIAAASAIVCANFPGVTPDDVREALRASVEELQGDVAALDRVLKILEAMAAEEESKGTLPGLPGGRSLRH